jgi:hypothetical protein
LTRTVDFLIHHGMIETMGGPDPLHAAGMLVLDAVVADLAF